MADEATTATETTETGTTAATAAATGATTETTSNGADTGAATGAEATETTAAKTDTEETTALGAAGKSAAIPEILGAPEGDYEVKAPEGKDFDKEAFDAVAPALKELNLSNKGAQAIVDVYADKLLPLIEQRVTKQIEERSQLATAEYRKQWLDDAKADPEIGGAKWDESLAISAKAMDAAGLKASDPFRTLLNDSGLGNHPDMVRFLRRVGEMIGEHKFEKGEATASTDNRPIWDRLYGEPTEPAAT
jgi:hypothetical protein